MVARPAGLHQTVGLVWTFLLLANLAACTVGSPGTTSASPTARTIKISLLGRLPVRPPTAASGPKLTLPDNGQIQVPGSFPFGSNVVFDFPVRNDGSAVLEIQGVQPG